jgi:hypothetical protein
MAGEQNRTRLIIVVIAVGAVIGIVAFALMQSTPTTAPAPLAASTPTPAPSAQPSITAVTPVVATTTHAAATGDSTPAAWENTIDGILRSNVSESQMAQMLINVLPTLPEDGQIEAANHIANLLPDSEYASVKPLLLNAGLPESVLSVFFTDLMNRDDSTKLNAFVDIAQMPNHPFQSEALSDLQIYVGDDYGSDWGKWRSAVSGYLKTANAQ